jgi:hypothetical protein
MSKFVPTAKGLFRAVKDEAKTRFLFQCPECGEWLPLNEESLAGRLSLSHELRGTDRYCRFAGPELLGPTLVATMQARLLMEDCGVPYETDERTALRETRDLGGQIFHGELSI